MVPVIKKELRGYFNSAIAVIFLAAFLAVALYMFFWQEKFFARGLADLQPFFAFHPWLYPALAAALSMRLWAEEKSAGTLEILLTLPVPRWKLVAGKFTAGMLLIAIALLLTLGIPLPVFDRGDHDEAAARASARAAAAEDRAAVRDAAGQVEALVAQRAALSGCRLFLGADTVPKSAQIVAQTRRAFDLGQAPLSDLLLAERAHRDLLLEVLDTRFELFGVRGQLRQALGLDDSIARSVQGRAP